MKTSFQFSLRWIFIAVSILAVLTFGYTLFSRRIQEVNIDPATANRRLEYIQSPIRIPEAAWDCSVIGGFHRTSCATFRIRESDFRWFAADLGLKLEEFDFLGWSYEADVDHFFRLIGGHTVNRSGRGLVANTMSRRGGWQIVFDDETGRAFVIHSHR